MRHSPFVLETCRGVKPLGCPMALPLAEGFVVNLMTRVATEPAPEALADLERPLRHHERFRLSCCACPNGCTRPHVADLGLVAARQAAVLEIACTGCGICVDACPDRAIAMADGTAVIDADKCLGCGACARVCQRSAILAGSTGFRVLVGGRLGRRPRLALELPGILQPQATLDLTGRCLTAWGQAAKPGLRFGDVLFPGGSPGLPAWVWP